LWGGGAFERGKRSSVRQDAVPALLVPHPYRVQAEIQESMMPKITPERHKRGQAGSSEEGAHV
jgi:hypothetical protein